MRVDGAGRIVGLARCRDRAVPPRLLLPGLVNAHVHLQLGPLPKPRRDFPGWIRAVLRDRREVSDRDHGRRGADALRRLVLDGVTAVGEIDSTGLSPALLREVPVGGRCYQEVVGFDLDAAGARRVVQQRLRPGSRWCPAGLSPHAPYSVSRDLFRVAHRARCPLAVHVAETAEELQLLRDGGGPLLDLLRELGRLPSGFRAPRMGAVEYLAKLGLLSPRSLLVHVQHASEREVQMIRRRRAPIVVCPGTIRYFRRQPPPVERWLQEGMSVALGTDSRASNTTLSLRREIALARTMWPGLSDETLLEMATTHGGVALSRRSCGRLVAGGPANFVALEMTAQSSLQDVLAAFVTGDLAPSGTWLRGRRFHGRRSVEAAATRS